MNSNFKKWWIELQCSYLQKYSSSITANINNKNFFSSERILTTENEPSSRKQCVTVKVLKPHKKCRDFCTQSITNADKHYCDERWNPCISAILRQLVSLLVQSSNTKGILMISSCRVTRQPCIWQQSSEPYILNTSENVSVCCFHKPGPKGLG